MSELSDLPIESNGEQSTVEEQIATDNVVCEMGNSKSRINGLTPPIGTMFHGHRTYTLWDTPVGHSDRKWGHVRWVVDAYTYASGADPRSPDFAQKGGKIHVVLVTRGYFKVYDNLPDYLWQRLKFTINPRDSGLVPISQLPPTGSGNQQGDDYQYTIDFGQRMSMLKNQGNEAFDFDAKYKEIFGLTLAKQSGSRAQYIEIGIEITKPTPAHHDTELYGVSVFTHTNPRAFPLRLNRYFKPYLTPLAMYHGIKPWAISGQWYLQLGFDIK